MMVFYDVSIKENYNTIMKTIMHFFSAVERTQKFSWRGLFEQTRQLKGLLFRVPLVVSMSMHKEVALAGCDFIKTVLKLKRRSGFLYTALYLKQCTVSLQRYYAGCYSKNDTMSVPVSLTRCGIPKIIPAVLRKHVRAKPDHGDYLVRIYLSWFGLSK